MNKYFLFFVVFFVSCGSGGDSSGSRINISWGDISRILLDETEDLGYFSEDEPIDIEQVNISSEGNQLRVKIDLVDAPSNAFLSEHVCSYRLSFETDETHISDDEDQPLIPIQLIAELSNCSHSFDCESEDAGISYGVSYSYNLTFVSTTRSFREGKPFSEFTDGNSIIFNIDANDFSKALSGLSRLNVSTDEEVGNLFEDDIFIDSNHDISATVSCGNGSDFAN